MDKKKILVVDDEPGVRATVSRMLENDYEVITATNGAEAISLAREQSPDLILMDLMMPKMDGYTACAALKGDEATSSIPIVILTAIGHELNKKYADEMGADAYMTKPFDKQELFDTAARYIKSIS
jgi:CheY-like chemotaxis protein